ncbi:hypothetical protein QBC37DRAFT_117279 [Rhypophila decipiens]|uniref:Uncharacterized protein n=1 Tax=Rhypophila decipiens TaxID=261697 RepID=A0AAN6YB26_9PEZI|nr:hypothetical protein QBC37DRAFT_117279 [Rhypophila decipiens]
MGWDGGHAATWPTCKSAPTWPCDCGGRILPSDSKRHLPGCTRGKELDTLEVATATDMTGKQQHKVGQAGRRWQELGRATPRKIVRDPMSRKMCYNVEPCRKLTIQLLPGRKEKNESCQPSSEPIHTLELTSLAMTTADARGVDDDFPMWETTFQRQEITVYLFPLSWQKAATEEEKQERRGSAGSGCGAREETAARGGFLEHFPLLYGTERRVGSHALFIYSHVNRA